MRKIYTPIRIIKRFAVFPITIGDEERWWETCYIKQRRYYGYYTRCPFYDDIEFATKAEYLAYVGETEAK